MYTPVHSSIKSLDPPSLYYVAIVPTHSLTHSLTHFFIKIIQYPSSRKRFALCFMYTYTHMYVFIFVHTSLLTLFSDSFHFRLLSEMAKEQIGKNPLRAKKLFVLAGLELERYRTRVTCTLTHTLACTHMTPKQTYTRTLMHPYTSPCYTHFHTTMHKLIACAHTHATPSPGPR